MSGFEALQKVKDDMMRPIYEKRRHLGCELCGNTFHGHYQKTGYQSDKVPNGKKSPHPTKQGYSIIHTYDDGIGSDMSEQTHMMQRQRSCIALTLCKPYFVCPIIADMTKERSLVGSKV